METTIQQITINIEVYFGDKVNNHSTRDELRDQVSCDRSAKDSFYSTVDYLHKCIPWTKFDITRHIKDDSKLIFVTQLEETDISSICNIQFNQVGVNSIATRGFLIYVDWHNDADFYEDIEGAAHWIGCMLS